MTIPVINWSYLEEGPLIICIAGPNGAGKSTFYELYLAKTGFRYINADNLAKDLVIDPYKAAEIAGELRKEFVRCKESFIFETVFSDPVGDKISFLTDAIKNGFRVLLVFIGIDTPGLSDQRVAIRVMQKGHDVPEDKIYSRYPRIMKNLKTALAVLPDIIVYDNSRQAEPFRQLVLKQKGVVVCKDENLPGWLAGLM